MKSLVWFLIAAFAEITGCYAFWLWLKMQRGPWPLLFGLPALVLFAYALTKIDAAYAGRVYAAYSAIYLLASLAWMRGVEGVIPDCWDLIGSAVCLVGAGIIMFTPR